MYILALHPNANKLSVSVSLEALFQVVESGRESQTSELSEEGGGGHTHTKKKSSNGTVRNVAGGKVVEAAQARQQREQVNRNQEEQKLNSWSGTEG